MKYLKQFCRIIFVAFVSEIIHELLPLPIPASIYGIVILFVLLETRMLKLESVRETGKFLIEIMPVMFIPAAVGLIDSWELIAPAIVQYILVIVASTLLVMGVSGVVTQAVIRGKEKAGNQE